LFWLYYYYGCWYDCILTMVVGMFILLQWLLLWLYYYNGSCYDYIITTVVVMIILLLRLLFWLYYYYGCWYDCILTMVVGMFILLQWLLLWLNYCYGCCYSYQSWNKLKRHEDSISKGLFYEVANTLTVGSKQIHRAVNYVITELVSDPLDTVLIVCNALIPTAQVHYHISNSFSIFD